MTTPRGIRNLNPLNIRRTSTTQWQGVAEVQRDREFVTFKSMRWGIRAACCLLDTYRRRYGLNTIAQIIRRWAPPQDGNLTEAYIRLVCEWMKTDAQRRIEPEDYPTLLRTMARVETGQWLPVEDFAEGYALWQETKNP